MCESFCAKIILFTLQNSITCFLIKVNIIFYTQKSRPKAAFFLVVVYGQNNLADVFAAL